MIKNKIKYFIISIAIIVIAFSTYIYMNQETASVGIQEDTKEIIVKKGNVSIEYLADGNSYLSTISLYFQENGVLKSLNVEVGEQVTTNMVMAKLDDKEHVGKIQDLEIKLRQAEAKLDKSKQQYELELISEKSKLESLKHQMEAAELQYFSIAQIPDAYSRYEINSKRIVYESAKTTYEAALATYEIILRGSEDIKLEEINVEQVKEELRVTREDITKTVLKSPIDGKVLAISSKVGEIASMNNEFVVLATNDPIQVRARVSEFDISQIEIGQKTRIEFESLSNQLFYGNVLSIDPLPIKDANGLVSYNVNIEIEGDDNLEKIKDGMSCYIAFILRERENVINIPNEAVSRTDGQQMVEVKGEDGNISSRNIKTGLTDGIRVEVLDGIVEDERIIIRNRK